MIGAVAAVAIALGPIPPPEVPPHLMTAPYVSCPGGYIAPELADCPYVPSQHRRAGDDDPPIGGGPRRRGLLGLGGIGGIL